VTLSNADRAEYGAIVVDPAQSEVIAAAHLRNLARNGSRECVLLPRPLLNGAVGVEDFT